MHFSFKMSKMFRYELDLWEATGKPSNERRSCFLQLYLVSSHAHWIHAIANGELRATETTSKKQWIELPSAVHGNRGCGSESRT